MTRDHWSGVIDKRITGYACYERGIWQNRESNCGRNRESRRTEQDNSKLENHANSLTVFAICVSLCIHTHL